MLTGVVRYVSTHPGPPPPKSREATRDPVGLHSLAVLVPLSPAARQKRKPTTFPALEVRKRVDTSHPGAASSVSLGCWFVKMVQRPSASERRGAAVACRPVATGPSWEQAASATAAAATSAKRLMWCPSWYDARGVAGRVRGPTSAPRRAV